MWVFCIWFRLGFRFHWVEVLYGGTSDLSFWAQGFYRVKSVSPFRFTMLLQGQINLHGSSYKVFTGSNQSLFFDLQGFYRVKSVSLFRFTMLFQGQIGHSFSIYKVFTGSNQSLFFDLQGFYRIKSVSLFWFSEFLQCWMIPSLFDLHGFYIIITMSQWTILFNLLVCYSIFWQYIHSIFTWSCL